jgi:delta 1-pyrroline-5-carboxylate dehydrogenase
MTEILDAPTRPSGRNYVGGAWVPAVSGDIYTKVNPMRPGETVGEFSSSSEADADAAVAAAEQAFLGWSALPLARRPLPPPLRPCWRPASAGRAGRCG